jgi:hypothetical protein
MFEPENEVISKWTEERAVVLHIDTEELMTVEFRTKKFVKGNLEGHGTQVLIKNFRLWKLPTS